MPGMPAREQRLSSATRWRWWPVITLRKVGCALLHGLTTAMEPHPCFPQYVCAGRAQLGRYIQLADSRPRRTAAVGSVSAPVNRWRRETLGLSPTSAVAPYKQLNGKPIPFLYGYSPSVVPSRLIGRIGCMLPATVPGPAPRLAAASRPRRIPGSWPATCLYWLW